MAMATSNFQFSVRVYYEDTDAGGVVYHANYLKFMERARSEFLIDRGCSVVECEQKFGVIFVVRNMEIDFILPARLGESLTVEIEVIKLGKVGVQMKQSIYNNQGLLICTALVKLAAISETAKDSFVLTPMPKALLTLFSNNITADATN